MKGGAKVLLHTERCGCADWLREKGIPFESLDALYEACEDFDEHARAAADAVLRAAESGDVAYGVFDIRDRSVPLIVEAAGERARVIPGPPAEGALLAHLRGETRAVEASDWEDFHLTPRENCLIRELDSRELAAEVKLRLMEVYPEESEIWLMNGDDAPVPMPLYELDRAERYDHRTCALIPAERSVTALERYDFEHLNEIMRRLCGPGGCPWDRAQTHESLRTCMLEEAYEVIDAIDEGDTDHLYDELGDVLLQVAIHSELARRHGEFDIGDVTTAICEKMIQRHTHIFGTTSAGDRGAGAGAVEPKQDGRARPEQPCRGAARRDPRAARAAAGREGAQAQRGGRACGTPTPPRWRRCAKDGRLPGASDAEAALGEALMDLAGVARLLKLDPEIALSGAVNRFIARFDAAEREIAENGGNFGHLTPQTLRYYWDLVKL